MECGECNYCCDLPEIKWLNKPANVLCKHWDKCCTIHETKDIECKEYRCGYNQMEEASIELRPDKCGVMFTKLSEGIFLGVLHPKRKITQLAQDQIIAFNKQGYSVVMYSASVKGLGFYISHGHDPNMVREEFEKLIDKWQPQVTQRT